MDFFHMKVFLPDNEASLTIRPATDDYRTAWLDNDPAKDGFKKPPSAC